MMPMRPPIQSNPQSDQRNVDLGARPGLDRSMGMPDILKKIMLQRMLGSRPMQGRPMGGGR